MNKKNIISLAMMICFAVSFLPVTNTWYLSLDGRQDLSRLVISAMSVKHHLDKKSSEKELADSINTIFRELKFATGQEKIHKRAGKKAITLTEILPEYPVLKLISTLTSYQNFFVLIPYTKTVHQTDQLPPESPPPEGVFVS